MEKFFRIKPRHIKGLRALIEQPTYKKAAEVSGVSERTLYRWVHENPDLRQELKFMLQEAFSHACSSSKALPRRPFDPCAK